MFSGLYTFFSYLVTRDESIDRISTTSDDIKEEIASYLDWTDRWHLSQTSKAFRCINEIRGKVIAGTICLKGGMQFVRSYERSRLIGSLFIKKIVLRNYDCTVGSLNEIHQFFPRVKEIEIEKSCFDFFLSGSPDPISAYFRQVSKRVSPYLEKVFWSECRMATLSCESCARNILVATAYMQTKGKVVINQQEVVSSENHMVKGWTVHGTRMRC